jgi:hypothetical protein
MEGIESSKGVPCRGLIDGEKNNEEKEEGKCEEVSYWGWY